MTQARRNVLGVLVDVVDYDAAVERIVTAASQSLARLSTDGHPIAELIGSIVSQDAWTLYRQHGYRDSLM